MIIFILLPSNVTFLFDFSRFTRNVTVRRDTDFKKHEQGTNTKEKEKKNIDITLYTCYRGCT